jgi:hypothetical protein
VCTGGEAARTHPNLPQFIEKIHHPDLFSVVDMFLGTQM